MKKYSISVNHQIRAPAHLTHGLIRCIVITHFPIVLGKDCFEARCYVTKREEQQLYKEDTGHRCRRRSTYGFRRTMGKVTPSNGN